MGVVRILIEAGAVALKNAEGTPVQEIIDTKLWEDGRHELVMESLIKEMLVLNPKTTEEQLRQGLNFGGGLLQNWNLADCNLEALPESFGNVRSPYVNLENNQLSTMSRYDIPHVEFELSLAGNNFTRESAQELTERSNIKTGFEDDDDPC